MPMSDFNERAATWDDDPMKIERSARIADVIRSTVPLRRDWRVIEVGGGTGLLSRALADEIGTATITDAAPGMIDVAREAIRPYAGWRAELYDIGTDPVPEERYDLVLSQLALHHMGDIRAVMHTAYGLLNDGGWVAIADLDDDPTGDFHADHADFHGHNGFRRDDIAQWLTDAGFVDVATTTAAHIPREIDGHERQFPLFLATGHRP